MKKPLFIIATVFIVVCLFFLIQPFFKIKNNISGVKTVNSSSLVMANEFLRIRKDKDALLIFKDIIKLQPDNLDALWGEAEVLRRDRKYKEAEEILNKVLSKNPKHYPSLISLAYIRYKDERLNEAVQIIKGVLKDNSLDYKNKALAYMMLGTINSRRSARGWFFSKIRYGTQIKSYFLKAGELAPDLPEVHLALGTFYLLAPAIAGGNLDLGLKELELAVRIAPDFATANARLAQVYKKKGINEKYVVYLKKARELDPENEVLREIAK